MPRQACGLWAVDAHLRLCMPSTTPLNEPPDGGRKLPDRGPPPLLEVQAATLSVWP